MSAQGSRAGDLIVDATGKVALKDCYLLACIGKTRKLFKHGESCSLPLTSTSLNVGGRIDILKRVGSTPVRLDPSLDCQDVSIQCDDSLGNISVKLSPKLKQEFGGDEPAVRPGTIREREKAHAMEYLAAADLQAILSEGIRAVLKAKPESPRRFLAEWLAKEPEKASPATTASPPKPFKPYTFKPSIGTWLNFLPDKECTTLPTEFEVVLDRSTGQHLGFEVSQPNGASLQVASVCAGSGLLGAWVSANRSLQVEEGDHILMVNGVRGNSQKLLAECEKNKLLHIKVKKSSAFDYQADCQGWLQNLKNSMQFPLKSHNRELTPCEELGEEELAALMAKYGRNCSSLLSLAEFKKLARSEFWLMTKLPVPEMPAQPPWMSNPFGNQAPPQQQNTGYKQAPPKSQTGEHLKLGIYQRSDGQAMGALSLRYAESPGEYARSFVFTVTNRKDAGEVEMWSATLEPAGLDGGKREIWRLAGHPSPSAFIQDEGHLELLECDFIRAPLAMCSSMDAGSGALVSSGIRKTVRTRQRHVWTFQKELCGMFFMEPVALPLEQRSKNFMKAVITKDPSTNETGAPDTQEIVKQYARYQTTLPDGPIRRQIELVNLYTVESPLYHEMNKALREDNLEKMKLFGAYIKELRDVFLTDHEYQIIKPFTGTVWRGISRVPDMEKAKRLYQPGKDFLWTAFTSTTTDKSVAMNWGQIVFEIHVDPPDGMYDDEVWEFAPADIKEFSAYKSESEVLFPPNVKFRVLEVREEQGKPLVVCIATALDGVGGQVEFESGAPCLIQDAEAAAAAEPLVKQLMDMGFPEVRARRALRATSNDLDSAKAWLEEHKADADIDAPLEEPQKKVIQRVQTRPKIGIYVSDKGAVGRLCIQKGRCGSRRAYIFTVTELANPEEEAEEYWVARLVHRGHDPQARDIWGLDGHPQGGTFVNDSGNFLELQDDGATQRCRWTWQNGRESPFRSGFLERTSTNSSSSPTHQERLSRSMTFHWDSRRDMD